MNRYVVVLRHGGGVIHVSTTACSTQKAIEQVCEFEGAPHSAVVRVDEKGPVYAKD